MKKNILFLMCLTVSCALISGCSKHSSESSGGSTNKSAAAEATSEDVGFTVYMEAQDGTKLSEVKPGSQLRLGVDLLVPQAPLGAEVQGENGCYRKINEVLIGHGVYMQRLVQDDDAAFFTMYPMPYALEGKEVRKMVKTTNSVIWIPVRDESMIPTFAGGEKTYMDVSKQTTFKIYNVDVHADEITLALSPVLPESEESLCGSDEKHPSAGTFKILLKGKDRGRGHEFTLKNLNKIIGDKASIDLAQ